MGASIASSTPKAVYQYTGKNLAPKRDLDTLARQQPVTNPNSFTLAIKKKYDEYMRRDNEVWNELYDTGQLVSNLTQGKLQVLRNPVTRSYAFVKKDSRFADRATVGGVFQFYMTKLDSEWLSSRPERDPICPSDDDQIEEFISAVKVVQDHYDKKFFTVPYELRECDSAKCFGTWITRYRFDPEVDDIICELLPFPACRWDIRFRAEESSYFIYESKCSNAVLEQLLNADIAPDGSDYNENYGLQVMEQIQKRGGNVSGEGKERPYGWTNNIPGENVVTEMWLTPEAYCDIDLSVSEPTVAGVTLPRGQSLIEMFPMGMCVVGINGMQTIIGLYAECLREHIVSGIYHYQSFSGVGKGVSDAVDVQKDLDDFHSQKRAYIKAHATPATYYAQGLITEEQARNIGKPRKVIPVDFNNAPEGMKSINEAIQTIVPANPATGIWEMGKQLEDHLQMAFQVTNFSDGLPGVSNKTATGVREGQQLAQQMLVPQHLNKADHRKRSDKVIYNLFKKFVNKKKFFASKDLNPITKGKYLSGNDFDGVDIEFEIVANSEVPKTPRAQEESLTRLFLATGGMGPFMEAAAMNPDVASDVLTAFGVKLSLPKKNDIARVCRRRIEQAKELLNIELENQQVMAMAFQSMGLPMPPMDNTMLAEAVVSQVTPPISPKEPYAQQKAAWMAELLDADEMNYAPQELRYVIEEMIDRQLQAGTLGEAQVAQDQNLGMVMANLPTLVGDQVMTRINQSLQMEAQAQEAEAQKQAVIQDAALAIEGERAKAEIDEERARADHERQMAATDKGQKNALQLEAVKQLAASSATTK